MRPVRSDFMSRPVLSCRFDWNVFVTKFCTLFIFRVSMPYISPPGLIMESVLLLRLVVRRVAG